MGLKDRNKEAEIFFNLLKNIKDGKETKVNIDISSYNICINARWGDGKTTFINNFLKPIIIKRKLYKEDQIITISAWEYDYLDNPLELIFDILYKKQKIKDKIIESLKLIIKELGSNFIDLFLEISPKWVSAPLISAIKPAKKLKDIKIKNTQNILKANYVIQELNKSFDINGEFQEYEYLIIIEDLDRCKPEFAKNLLEICKHVFNSKCFTMIYVCDWELINSMTSNNKNEEYNELYLDRIIDYVFDLRKIDMEKYFSNKYMQEINSYFNAINTSNGLKVINGSKAITTSNYFHNIVDFLTIREQEIAYKKISKIFIRQKNNLLKKRGEWGIKYDVYPELYRFLLRKLLGKKNNDNNIFEDFFEKDIYFTGNANESNENERKKIIREIIIKAILSTFYIIEIGKCDFLQEKDEYHKTELYLRDIILIDCDKNPENYDKENPKNELNDWFAKFENYTLIKFYDECCHQDGYPKTIGDYSKNIDHSENILKGLKKYDIFERINQWFKSEYKRY